MVTIAEQSSIYIKMMGRKIYEYAIVNVPLAMKETLEKSNVDIKDVKKIFIHQANEKMDHAITQTFLPTIWYQRYRSAYYTYEYR